MANVDRNIGFRPHNPQLHSYQLFTVDSTNSTAIFVGDVIDHDGTGAIPAAANAGVSAIGVAVALYDSGGVPVGMWASSVSTKYLTASTAGFVLVAKGIPGAEFVAQGQSGQTPTVADIGATTDHVAGSGDTTTAVSHHELNLSDLNSGAQFRILRLLGDPANSYGVNADLIVSFNESMFNPSTTGV